MKLDRKQVRRAIAPILGGQVNQCGGGTDQSVDRFDLLRESGQAVAVLARLVGGVVERGRAGRTGREEGGKPPAQVLRRLPVVPSR